MIKTYDSIATLREDALRLGRGQIGMGRGGTDYGGNSWYGGESPSDTLRKSELGDLSLVSEAETLIDQLDTQIETPRRVWERSPAGAFCVVPDVLAGLPTYMRYQREVGDEHQAIEIFVVASCSAAINAKTLQKRGATILALTMALARVRPISLHIVDIGNGPRDYTGETTNIARIETAPLDFATACYVLSSAGFVRRLMYGLAEKQNGFSGGWPETPDWSYNSPALYYDNLVARVARDPARTLLIGGAQLGDELLSQPVTWLNKQIARFVNSGEGQD
jgi:hypothetical protein